MERDPAQDFAEVSEDLAARRGNTVSWYETIIPDLTDEQRTALDAALDDRRITAVAIATVLERWGHRVKVGTISSWRRNRGRR